jgi:hypothetical protein
MPHFGNTELAMEIFIRKWFYKVIAVLHPLQGSAYQDIRYVSTRIQVNIYTNRNQESFHNLNVPDITSHHDIHRYLKWNLM